VARPKNQNQRREELVQATERAVLRRGLGAVRLRDVAEEAGVTSAAVLYYYDEIHELLVETHRRAIERFCAHREDAADAIEDPRQRLIAAVRGGLPTGPEDTLVRLIYQFDSQGMTDPSYGAHARAYFERQVAIYHSILVAGSAAKVFTLTAPARVIARNLVALEDGHGYYVAVPGTEMDAATAERYILSYAEVATGCRLSPEDSAAPGRAASQAAASQAAASQAEDGQAEDGRPD
jgi:AcrR family transcriptional regulator